MLDCLAVGLGGLLGSICRYLLGLIPLKNPSEFPFITLVINVLGAFVLSVVATLAAKNSISPRSILFLKVGLCGGFTTFSTFAYESAKLLSSGSTGTGILYMCLSAVLGVLAVFAGSMLVR